MIRRANDSKEKADVWAGEPNYEGSVGRVVGVASRWSPASFWPIVNVEPSEIGEIIQACLGRGDSTKRY